MGYTASAENTTRSTVFKFKLGINSTDDIERLITLRKAGSNGYRFWFGVSGTKVRIGTFTAGAVGNMPTPVDFITGAPSEYDVEIAAIDLADGSGVWQYVKINDVLVLSAKQPLISGTAYPHVCVGGNDTAEWTLTDVSESEQPPVTPEEPEVPEEPELPIYTDGELADYDIISVKNICGAETYTVPAAANSYTEKEMGYTASAGNTTRSTVFKFKLGINTTADIERLITLRKAGGNGYRFWFGVSGTKVRIGTAENWTVGNMYEPVDFITGAPSEYDVEIAAIDLADGSGVWQYVKINDVLVLSAKQPLVSGTAYPHVCVGGNDTAEWTLKNVAALPTYMDEQLANYDVISVKDICGAVTYTVPAAANSYTEKEMGYTASAENTTRSTVFKFKLGINSTDDIERLITLRKAGSNGYRFWFGVSGTKVRIGTFTAGAVGNMPTPVDFITGVPSEYDVEIAAIDLADGSGVWQYVKINDELVLSAKQPLISGTAYPHVCVGGNDSAEWTLTDVNSTALTVIYNGETVKTGAVEWSSESLNSYFDDTTLTDAENIFIGYEYNGGLYKQISDIEKPDNAITVEAITLNFYVLDGASIRMVQNSSGIRFIAKIVKNDYVNNYSILFTETEIAAMGFDKTSLSGKKYLEIGLTTPDFKQTENGDGSTSFAVAVTGLTVEQYDLSFSARGWVEIEYADGSTMEYYTDYAEDKNARTIRYVANAALNDEEANYTAEQKAILFTYIGNTINTFAYFSPESGITNLDGTESYRGMATVEDMKTYFDAGYDYFLGESWTYESWKLANSYNGGKAQCDLLYLLDLAAEYCETYDKSAEDCKIVVQIDALWELMQGGYDTVDVTDESTTTTWKNNLKAYIDHIKNYTPANGGINCFAGIMLRDEPTGAMLADYTYWYNYLAGDLGLLDDGYYLTGALLGELASDEQLKVDGYSYSSEESYYDVYIQTFIDGLSENVKAKTILKYDNYSLLTVAKRKLISSSGSSYMTYRNTFYSNMQTVAEKGMQSGIILQSFAQYDTSKVEASATSQFEYFGKLDHEGYISLQAYAAMAYGFENIGYFSYCEHFRQTSDAPYYDAQFMYNESTGKWEKQAMYDYVASTNEEIRKLQTIYTGFDWQGTKLVAGSSVTNGFGKATDYTAYSGVLNSMTATQDAIAGCFTMGDTVQYEGFMVANMGLPTNESNSRYFTTTVPSANNISMTFAHCTQAIVYLDGVAQVMNLTNGVLNLNLAFGEGAFVIPLA